MFLNIILILLAFFLPILYYFEATVFQRCKSLVLEYFSGILSLFSTEMKSHVEKFTHRSLLCLECGRNGCAAMASAKGLGKNLFGLMCGVEFQNKLLLVSQVQSQFLLFPSEVLVV
jgi:hypothetical protein